MSYDIPADHHGPLPTDKLKLGPSNGPEPSGHIGTEEHRQRIEDARETTFEAQFIPNWPRQKGLNKLRLADLAAANRARLPEFKNSKGEPAHTKADGSDWTPAQWLQAVVGELGEYANFRKKYERGDISLEEFKIHGGKELADVQTYLSILAMRCLDTPAGPHPTGIDLAQATVDKFNEVSNRVGSTVRLQEFGFYYQGIDLGLTDTDEDIIRNNSRRTLDDAL